MSQGPYAPMHRSPSGITQPPEGATLADILERVLDKGIVIAGDIQINLLEVELLTIKLRLLVASVDRAKEMGIDWWESDPSLTSVSGELENENQELKERLSRLEEKLEALASGEQDRQGADRRE
jgi:Gas vesicle protein